ncbi:MAG: AAA family ATPase [Sulfuricurvum sp.]
MNINLDNIKYKNFLSYGETWTVFNFKNGVDIFVGTNGMGKSSMNDAIFYALFGRPYRKIKTSSLVNRTNKKKLEVQLELDVDDKSYRIIRGMAPNKFEIFVMVEGEYTLIEERASIRDYQNFLENEVLKVNETIFRQLISLGANNPNSKPFMELSQQEKESLFQVLTDTSIFGHIKNVLKTRIQDKKTVLKDQEYRRDILSSSLESEKLMISQLEKQNEDFLAHHTDNIRMTTESISNCESNIEKYKSGLEKLKNLKLQYDELNLDLDQIKQKRNTFISLIQKNKHSLNHIESAQAGAINCVECNTINYLVDVDVSIKDKLIEENAKAESEASILLDQQNTFQDSLDGYKEKLLNGKRIRDTLQENENNLVFYKDKLNELNAIKQVEINYDSIEAKKSDMITLSENIKLLKTDIDDLLSLENLVGGNGIKQQVIRKQIPLLNKGINHFLELFSMLEYNFVIDETFQERIISRDKDSEFNALSNGQKSRISFAIMFAFLKLIEERNGVKINLLVLDEVLDSSVDATGREELLSILKDEFSGTKDIIIISHNDEIKNKLELFDRLIHVQKDKFSSVKVEELR